MDTVEEGGETKGDKIEQMNQTSHKAQPPQTFFYRHGPVDSFYCLSQFELSSAIAIKVIHPPDT